MTVIVPEGWIPYGRRFQDLQGEGLATVGTWVLLKDSDHPQLIGDINVEGGVCGECNVEYDIVVAYRPPDVSSKPST